MPDPTSPAATRRQLRRERTLAAAAAILDGPDERAAGRLAHAVARVLARSLAGRRPPSAAPAAAPEGV